jgi:Tfp pilus assembly protein PilF
LGQGNDAEAAQTLQRVVNRDPNHLAAQTLLAQISRTVESAS